MMQKLEGGYVSFSRLKRELASQGSPTRLISQSGRLPHPYGLESWQTAPATKTNTQNTYKNFRPLTGAPPAAGV